MPPDLVTNGSDYANFSTLWNSCAAHMWLCSIDFHHRQQVAADDGVIEHSHMCATQKFHKVLKLAYSLPFVTKLGGISPSILVMQTTEYRFRKYRSSLGYGFHLAVCRRFLLNLIGNTWS